MIKYIIISITIFLSSFEHINAQKNPYAMEILDEICSEKYHGRGYDYGSDKLVSKFIVNELKKNNVKSINNTYLQNFNISVNTFPEMISVRIGEKVLEPGTDFFVSGFSKPLTGTLNIIKLTSQIINDSIQLRNFITKDFSNSALLIDTTGLGSRRFDEAYQLITMENILKAKLVIKVDEKNLVFAPSPTQKKFTCITIKRDAIPNKIEKITVDINSIFVSNYQTNNIIGFIKGKIDSSIVITGHYDHIGMMGLSTFFPGANDNGSGVAMLLNIAKHFSVGKKPDYNIVFIFFSAEELGILGSKFYSENPVFPLSKIKFLLNLDMVGTGSKGIKVVNGTVFKEEFNRLLTINSKLDLLEEISPRAPAANSDHYYFYEKGVKSFFIYTLGDYKEYHNVNDKPENLPLTEFDDLSELIIEFINSF